MSEELKKCPFCGGEAKTKSRVWGGKKKFRLYCGNRKCLSVITHWYDSFAEAIAAWNKRIVCPL
jgi:hypothetical protein